MTAGAIAIGTLGCGGAKSDRTIVRVGASSIGEAELAHWMVVMAPEHLVPDPPRFKACAAQQALVSGASGAELVDDCRRMYELLRHRVLDFLIVSRWRMEEAAREGRPVSKAEIRRALEARKRSYTAGNAEYQESLRATGRSVSDSEFEIQGELAVSAIRARLQAEEPKITQAELESYYRQHIHSFFVPERRRIYIVENLKSSAQASSLRREFAHGKSIKAMSLDETFPRSRMATAYGEKLKILEAIFAARPHVVAPPVRLNKLYFLFEVTHITPAFQRTFAEVKEAIASKLRAPRRRATLARFISQWRARWTARTDCLPRYVVQKCRQYHGAIAAEDPLGFN